MGRFRQFIVAAIWIPEAFAQAPVVTPGGIVNAASFQPGQALSPGSLVSIFGVNLAASTVRSGSLPLSTSLGDVSATFNSVPAPLLYVSSGQINAQLPWNVLPAGATSGTATVVVTRSGVSSPPATVQVGPFAPGVFALTSGNQLLAVAVNNSNSTLAQPPGSVSGIPSQPARSGSIVIIYATGLGAVNPPATNGQASEDTLRTAVATPTVLIGGQQAQVLFAGLAPQFVGVNQLNVVVPAGITAGNAVPVQIQTGGVISPGKVTMAVDVPRQFPDTTDGIFVFSDQLETSQMTEGQFRFAAAHYVGAQKLLPDGARHLRQYNDSFVVLHYRLGQGLGNSFPTNACQPTDNFIQIIDGAWVNEWPGDAGVQESWFFHQNGQRVFNCDYGWYLMELNDPGWRQWWSSQVILQLLANEDDGVFADSYNVPNYGFRWNPGLPIVDATFESAWAAREQDFTDYIRGRFAGRWKWIPNIGAYITTRDPSDYSNVDGVMIEQFAESGSGGYFAEGDWQLQMNRILPLVTADKYLIAQTYPSGDDVNERLFDLGSYLLIKGAHTYINLLSFGQNVQWFPEYTVDLGAPLDSLAADISAYFNPTWQVYQRRYVKGMVLVNPADTAFSALQPGGTFYQVVPSGGGTVPPDGTAPGSLCYKPVTSIDLCSHCAAVLLNQLPAAAQVCR